MFEKKEYDSPSWLGSIDRTIFNLIRPVLNLNFSTDNMYPYYPKHYEEDDDVDLPSWDGDGGSSFLYELPNGKSEFRIHNLNDKYAIRALNPHIFGEIAHIYDISKIIKFDMQATNVIAFVSPHLFQPIKTNLNVVEFEECYLADLPLGLFRNLDLQRISFINCEFGSLSEDFGLSEIGSIETLILYDNVFSNNIDIRPQLKILEKAGTDVIFKPPLDPRDISLEEKIRSIYSSE